MEIITVTNQKGGCGKTITAVNLAGALARLGKKVLFIDMDPQCHGTSSFGIYIQEAAKSTYAIFDCFLNNKTDLSLSDIMQRKNDNLWIIGSHLVLNTIEQRLSGMQGAVLVLSNTLRKYLKIQFDYIIIDTPPNLGFLTLNAMHSASRILIPLDVSLFSLNGVSQIGMVLDLSNSMGFSRPKVNFLITLFDKRSNFAKAFVDKTRDRFGNNLFQTVIRSNIKVREAVEAGKTILEFDPSSNGAKDYEALANEIISEERQGYNRKNIQIDTNITYASFNLYAPDAESVYVVGNFNNWATDETSLMKKLENGTWVKMVSLPEGIHQYKFVVDGKWIEDPNNSLTEINEFGGRNSLIMV